ncbi:hypothetical protein LTR84_002722 [Exophiala bonariae]|uniref:Bacteriocin-protection protein, YdeI/OmpD-associated family n=1 Tax=Exophiala bonariae TaxID=1690606 RepID=A0AAV9N9S3_9EURO|nr:hypothetical protein LTR84_002722 [Exophiala bonariae]
MPAQSQTTAKLLPTDLPIRAFSSAADLEAFLEREHTTAAGIHLKLAKKSSGIPSISGAEAVEIALCFGWIDGRANPFDDSWWLLRFTPRRAKSMWSQKNVNTVARLTTEGRMRPAGIAAVEAAKLDGRWDRAYAGPATMTTPDDLASALSADPAATAFFESMTRTDRYSILMRLQTASAKTRDQRVRSIVEKLSADQAKSTGLKSKTSNGVKKAKPKPKSKARTQASRIIPVVADSSGDPPQINPPRRAGLRSRS